MATTKLDRRTTVSMSWTPENGSYEDGMSGGVGYDRYKRTWTASITFADFYENIEPDNGEGDAIYFTSLQDGVKWVEGVFTAIQGGKTRDQIPGFQGFDTDNRARKAEQRSIKAEESEQKRLLEASNS